MRLIVSTTIAQNRQTLRNWWAEARDSRGIVFPSQDSRAVWVNEFEDPATRELAMRMTFTAQGAFYGRDDVTEVAVAHANETLPVLFKRLGVFGQLRLVTGTSPLGMGW